MKGLSAIRIPKLSKLPNQEDALGTPWLRGELLSAGAPSRGAGMLRTGVIRRFDFTLSLDCTPSHHAVER
jgi:hypothetical protein